MWDALTYLVFSRKYRPATFDDLLGQEHVGRTLRNAIEGGRLAHAYLFSGPRGVGKTTMARILAKAACCLVSPGAAPCLACEACEAIAKGDYVDVLEIDAASNRGVEDAEALTNLARFVPMQSKKKVFIVDEVHMLSKHAFNALLKTLEEPPPHVLFVLATTEANKIPETVRSRCQRFDFRRITPADIAAKLRRIAAAEKVAVEEEVFAEIARRAVGGLRDAETLFDQVLGAAPPDRPLQARDLVAILGGVPREMRTRILEQARAGAMNEALEEAGRCIDAGGDPAELLADLAGDLHDAAVAEAREGGGGFGVEWCLAATEIVARHQQLAREARAARDALDLALLAMAKLGDVRDLEELAGRLERLASGGPAGAPAVASSAAPARAPAGTHAAAPSATRVETPRAAAPPPPSPSSPACAPPRPVAGPPPAAAKLSGLASLRRAAGLDREPEEPSPAGDELAVEPSPPENAAPARGLSSEELQRIRVLPLVRAVVADFEGRIEQVRRDEDEQAVR